MSVQFECPLSRNLISWNFFLFAMFPIGKIGRMKRGSISRFQANSLCSPQENLTPVRYPDHPELALRIGSDAKANPSLFYLSLITVHVFFALYKS